MAKSFKSLALLALAALSVVGTSALSTECNKPNEEKRCVTACPPAKTCKNKDIQVACLHRLSKNCKDTCVCKDGYFRNAGGECVTSDDCTKCGGQNEYFSCRVRPDKSCASLTSESDVDDTSECTGPSDQCEKECVCTPGTARDENNVCVPYDQCNKPCSDNEAKDYCPTDCASDYCPKSEKVVSCPSPRVCPDPQCKCRFNYRRADNGTCIPTRSCPPFECSKPDEEYNPCPPLCPNGSCGQATPSGNCPPLFGRIGVVLMCNPACRCKKGWYWNDDKKCVPYDQCPGKGNTSTTQ